MIETISSNKTLKFVAHLSFVWKIKDLQSKVRRINLN